MKKEKVGSLDTTSMAGIIKEAAFAARLEVEEFAERFARRSEDRRFEDLAECVEQAALERAAHVIKGAAE